MEILIDNPPALVDNITPTRHTPGFVVIHYEILWLTNHGYDSSQERYNYTGACVGIGDP